MLTTIIQRPARSIRTFLLIALALGASTVFAQTQGTGTDAQVGSLSFGFQWLIDNMLTQSILDQFLDGAIGIANRLTGPARILAGTLAAAALFWGVMMAFINKKPPMNVLVEVVIFAAISALMIENFTWVANGARHYANEVMASESIAAKAGQFVKALFISFGAVIENVLKSVVNLNIFQIGDALLALVAVCVAIVFGFLSLVTLIGLALQGPFALGIGLAISPMISATIANPYTRRWFDQWLNFMVGAAFLTALVYIALTLLMSPILSIMNVIATGKQISLAGTAIQAAILMFFASKMLAAVPSISDALFPGRTGTGSITSSVGDLAKSAKDIATSVAALKIAAVASAKFGGSAAVGTLNTMSDVGRAMQAGVDFGRNQAGGNVGEKISAGVAAAGVDMAGKPMGDAKDFMKSTGASVASGWAKDRADGVRLGDRVANVAKTAAESLGKVQASDVAGGALKAAAGGAATVAGAAGHLASGAAGKVAEGARDQVNKAKSAAQHRNNVRDDMLNGMPKPNVNTQLKSVRDNLEK